MTTSSVDATYYRPYVVRPYVAYQPAYYAAPAVYAYPAYGYYGGYGYGGYYLKKWS